MRNVAFAIWMVGYSFNMSYNIHQWETRLSWNGVMSASQSASLIICFSLWIIIGCLLYEREKQPLAKGGRDE
jgi:hypothetical protein